MHTIMNITNKTIQEQFTVFTYLLQKYQYTGIT